MVQTFPLTPPTVNVPILFVENVMLPAGVTRVPGETSVTNAKHVDRLLTATFEQLITSVTLRTATLMT